MPNMTIKEIRDEIDAIKDATLVDDLLMNLVAFKRLMENFKDLVDDTATAADKRRIIYEFAVANYPVRTTLAELLENLRPAEIVAMAQVANATPIALRVIAGRTTSTEVLRAVAENAAATAAVLTEVRINAASNAVSDLAVARNNKTNTADLRAIATRTGDAGVLAAIAGNASVQVTEAVLTDVVGNGSDVVDGAVLTAVTTRNAALSARSEAVDLALANHGTTLTTDLRTIATRTADTRVLTAIARHANADAALLAAVVAHPAGVNATVLHEVTENAAHNDVSDLAVTSHNDTVIADLTTIAVRTTNIQVLAAIRRHPNADAALRSAANVRAAQINPTVTFSIMASQIAQSSSLVAEFPAVTAGLTPLQQAKVKAEIAKKKGYFGRK